MLNGFKMPVLMGQTLPLASHCLLSAYALLALQSAEMCPKSKFSSAEASGLATCQPYTRSPTVITVLSQLVSPASDMS